MTDITIEDEVPKKTTKKAAKKTTKKTTKKAAKKVTKKAIAPKKAAKKAPKKAAKKAEKKPRAGRYALSGTNVSQKLDSALVQELEKLAHRRNLEVADMANIVVSTGLSRLAALAKFATKDK